MPQNIRLIHWNEQEAEERVARLTKLGYRVDFEPLDNAVLKSMRTEPPAAVVIDLSRLPSHGRDVAVALRTNKSTSRIPLVFVDGAPEKVERVRDLLPDAVFTGWNRIRSALKKAIANPPANPVRPHSQLAGYSGTPLPKKLGIKPNSVLTLLGAPADFVETLGELPQSVKLRRQARGKTDLVIWFPESRGDLLARIERIGELTENGDVWVAWPKQASKIPTDLTQAIVRAIGLAAGLVDYKICAIDQKYSGLRFTRRKS